MSPVAPTERSSIRVDLQQIADIIPAKARLLDVGCGDGALLAYLVHDKQVDGRGIELSQAGVNVCVGRGLSVIQGDADTDLAHYPDQAFDYAVLSQTLQATREPRRVLGELVRIARCAIVSLPNFGHWRMRTALLFKGRMPHTATLAHQWYDTPNIHLCTITDFVDLASAMALEIERSVMLDDAGCPLRGVWGQTLANLLAAQGLFVLRRRP